MNMNIYDGLTMPSESTLSLSRQLPESVMALSEDKIGLKDFIFTFVHSELLRGKSIPQIEDNIKFRAARASKAVEEIEALKTMTVEDAEKRRQALQKVRENNWNERQQEMLSKKRVLTRYLDQAKNLKSPNEDFNAFFLHFTNKIRFAIYIIDEHILSDTFPEDKFKTTEDWRSARISDLEKSMKEHDRVTALEVSSLQDIKEWMDVLDKSLEKQIE